MRLIMFGTGPFAVPTFESLLQSSHDVLGLVTRPITDPGKRRKTAENPTRDVAVQHGFSILEPQDVNSSDSVARLIEMQADLFVVCDYGQILSRDCLGASRLGGINLHGSLLPKYRGAAPINWAIYHGDQTTGITIIHMTAKLDAGPCLVIQETEIGIHETAVDIEPRLARIGVPSVLDAISMLETWDGQSSIGTLQDRALATRAPRLKKSDGQINWERSATQIANQIRAFQPWPGSFSSWHSDELKQPMRLIIHQATEVDSADGSADVSPGQVAVSTQQELVVQTGEGMLSINIIQPAGKRAMPIADFLRGNPPAVGDCLR